MPFDPGCKYPIWCGGNNYRIFFVLYFACIAHWCEKISVNWYYWTISYLIFYPCQHIWCVMSSCANVTVLCRSWWHRVSQLEVILCAAFWNVAADNVIMTIFVHCCLKRLNLMWYFNFSASFWLAWDYELAVQPLTVLDALTFIFPSILF